MTGRPSVVWVVPDQMGGALHIVRNLLDCRDPHPFDHHLVLTDNALSTATRFDGRVAADTQQMVRYRLPVENLYAVLRRLRRAIPEGDGILVANDLVELAMVSAFDTGRTVMQILHGDYDYYYDLAVRHEPVVDVFIAYASGIAETLKRRLPHRADDVFHLPHGVRIPNGSRASRAAGPLRLVFVGRLVEGKGIFDLPAIDGLLRSSGIAVTWTVVGAGPDEQLLRDRWPGSHVRWTGALPHADVLELYREHDVFVLPSRAEGFPVTLLEAMAAGLAPVVSDLPSGVGEVVEPGVTGWLPRIGDVQGFADVLRMLAGDRARIDAAGAAARARVARDFDIRERVRGYERLFARHQELRRPRPADVRVPYGSRLDRRWIPNLAVKAVRTVVRRAAGKPC